MRNNFLLFVIALYLILNYGFMQVRIPPVDGGGIPIGEFVLIISLLTVKYSTLLPRLSSIVFIVPFLLWWLYGLTYSLLSIPEYGMWALRDASQVIESLFILVGFAVVSRPFMWDKVFKWLAYILIVVCIYSLGYPYLHILQEYSPKVGSGAGVDVAIFFNYTNTPTMLLMAASYLLVFYSDNNKSRLYFLLAVTLIAYAILSFQSRTVYLQVIGLFFLFMIYRRRLLGKGVLGLMLIVVLLMIMPLIGIQFSGRLNQEVSLEFIFNHFAAIGGVESEGLEGAASGVGQRIGWWLNLYDRWLENGKTFLFGLGYGFPLIDFGIAHGIAVREPHNSYISILARGGLFGAVLWVWMHLQLIKVWRLSYLSSKRSHNRESQNRLLILMVYFVLVWIFAIGEDAFEKPFIAIPYYFFWGIILRFYYNSKKQVFKYRR